MIQPTSGGLSLKIWVRDRILFLAVVIFFVGGAAYIGAGKFLDPQNEWLHPIKEFALLLSLVGVVSLGYELFLREMTFREYKNALEDSLGSGALEKFEKVATVNMQDMNTHATMLYKNFCKIL